MRSIQYQIRCLAALLALLLLIPATVVADTGFMALNGVNAVTIEVNGVRRDFEAFGLTNETILANTTDQLRESGIVVVGDGANVMDPATATMRIKIRSNENQYRFYHYGVSIELQRKIPLNNEAGGYLSGTAWKQGRTGIVMPTELRKLQNVIGELLTEFAHDYHAQNGAAVSFTE